MRTVPHISQHSGGFGNVNIEYNDTYGVNSLSQASSGHGSGQANFAMQYSGFHTFVVALGTSYNGTSGEGGVCLMDQNNDMFILSSEL